MFEPLPTPAQMARWDHAAIHEVGIRGELLMENAGREALNVLRRNYGPLRGARVLVLAGPGNNGGDAFVLARHLHDLGADTVLLHSRAQNAYKGHARYHLRLAKRVGTPLRRLTAAQLERIRLHGIRNHGPHSPLDDPHSVDILVDGLLGTGFSGLLRSDMLEIIHAANRIAQNAFTLSLDIPSGLNGATGTPQPEAVHADVTATFGAVKLGLALPAAQTFTGMVAPCDIGIPNFCLDAAPPDHFRITPEIMGIAPAPQPAMHKGQAGHLLVIGGSPGLTGAPHLAALAALRAGCGLVTVAAPASLCREIKGGRPEIMTLPLDGAPGTTQWDQTAAQDMIRHIADNPTRYNAVALGPGMGRHADTADFIRRIGPHLPQSTVCDADALYHLSQMPDMLPPGIVMTPHPGEAARLLHVSSTEVQADRLHAVRSLARRYKAVAVLKGAWTLVADSTSRVLLCDIAAPALAVGGSGDVLTGLTGAMLAAGISPLHAACLSVYWHAAAGKFLETDQPRGHLAGDIADALPRVRFPATNKQPINQWRIPC